MATKLTFPLITSHLQCPKKIPKISSFFTPYKNLSLKKSHFFGCKKIKRLNLCGEIITEDETQKGNLKRKLFVLNLPWSFTVDDIKNLFSQCGIVDDVEIIKQKNGKSRGFAFVTMESGEQAQAVVDKFDSHEILGRIIRIEFSNKFKRTRTPRPPGPQPGETRHKLYVSNLAWKARSSHLKEFFGADYSPVSARVVFDSPSGRSAGYGFVTFATKDEAESALSSLEGKEIFGRPVRLKFSETDSQEASDEKEEEASDEKEVEVISWEP